MNIFVTGFVDGSMLVQKSAKNALASQSLFGVGVDKNFYFAILCTAITRRQGAPSFLGKDGAFYP